MLRQSGGEYFNPDEAARALRRRNPSLSQPDANATAWKRGVEQLERSVRSGTDYFFETTLGGSTIPALLQRALAAGHEVRVWYAGLSSVELHLARVAARAREGGHDIPEADVRRRYDDSRRNLIALLPYLTELKVYDNSAEANPATGRAPSPKLVLHWRDGAIVSPTKLGKTPAWAKAIVAQAIKRSSGG